MLFNSIEFWFFFIPIFLSVHFLSHKNQNYILLISSYLFYGFWDWRFLGLILFSTLTAYMSGRLMTNSPKSKEKLFYLKLTIIVNLIILAYFKYANFFISTFMDLFNITNDSQNALLLTIILPVGISFYTFQSISYVVDLYRGDIKDDHGFTDVALYIALFPQLVAGPIERGSSLIPQIIKPRFVNTEK